MMIKRTIRAIKRLLGIKPNVTTTIIYPSKDKRIKGQGGKFMIIDDPNFTIGESASVSINNNDNQNVCIPRLTNEQCDKIYGIPEGQIRGIMSDGDTRILLETYRNGEWREVKNEQEDI